MLKTKLKSIFTNRCPQCLTGRLFFSNNPFIVMLKQGGECAKNCSHCGLKFERELGFWYGAMYVSYGVGVAIFVAAWVATYLFLPDDSSIPLRIGVILVAILILAPINYFLSRLIWVNLFVKYKPELDGNTELGSKKG